MSCKCVFKNIYILNSLYDTCYVKKICQNNIMVIILTVPLHQCYTSYTSYKREFGIIEIIDLLLVINIIDFNYCQILDIKIISIKIFV